MSKPLRVLANMLLDTGSVVEGLLSGAISATLAGSLRPLLRLRLFRRDDVLSDTDAIGSYVFGMIFATSDV